MSTDVHPARIVLLADGTGNAFAAQASNIWRLYGALDLSDPDQVVHYIRGVGTSGFRPLAVIDGATGLGVPANVRELYRFLCRTWRPGVDVYLFGFSRGAFTIRTLVGLVASQGLVPVSIDGRPVGRAELRRMSMAAWRAYRAETAPAGHVWPTITVTRAIRDAVLRGWGRLCGHRPYDDVRRLRDDAGRRAVALCFAGLFDTVEAYGVPLEELRTAITRTIWPISFRNRQLSPIVRRARHALSLDDERVSFHPVRFDQSGEAVTEVPRIREVWFAGMHSDVGGGYPDDALAHVPLKWMIDEATACGGDSPLVWRPGTAEGIAAAAAPLAAAHDSRAGFASLYRYGPRIIGAEAADGEQPIVHHAVAEKMVFGPDDYAPLTLPSVARVLMPDGRLRPIRGFDDTRGNGPDAADMTPPEAAERAVARLSRPNAGYVQLARDRIWLRVSSSRLLALAVVVTAALPVVAPWLDRLLVGSLASAGAALHLPSLAAFFQRRIDDARGGLGANLTDLQSTFGGLVPGYAKGWVQAVVDQPLAALLVIGITAALYRANGLLRDRIADAARCAWFIDADGGGAASVPSTRATRLARRLRSSARVSSARTVLARTVAPALMLSAALAVGLVLVDRAAVSYASGSGAFCPSGLAANLLRQPRPGQSNRAEGFTPDQPCWPTGLWLEKGRSYRLWMEAATPLLDGDAVAPLEGYTGGSWRRWLTVPFRRWWGAAWFQPIARIGSTGTVEWPLVSSEGVMPQPLPEAAQLPAGERPRCAPARVPAAAVAEAVTASAARQGFASQFVAPATGELFVFVNDAVPLPFGPPARCLYADNAGAAVLTVELLPVPTPPAGDAYDFSANR